MYVCCLMRKKFCLRNYLYIITYPIFVTPLNPVVDINHVDRTSQSENFRLKLN